MVERRSYEAFGKIRAMDYGTNNNTFANTTIETTRAFTGHEQIAELSGLIHMNARVYDSDIGRFLSADSIIQAPHDSQSYNRYSYVRNNPLKYTDPTGNSWWTKFRDKWVKPIVSIIISAVIIAATMGYGALATTWIGGLNAVQAGALVGGISGGIMTGSLTGAVKGAIFGAISAGIANGIGNVFSKFIPHGANLFNNAKYGVQLLRAATHGLSRGIISVAQGGTFKAGFASGFSASFFSPGTTMGGDEAGGFGLRTSIAAIVGGTASEIGGGKFSNGAISGAFVHMFNAEGIAKRLTFGVVRNHYMHGDGSDLNVLASSVDLSKVNSSIFKYIGHRKSIQLFFHGNEYSSLNDALVYGGITLEYAGGNQVKILSDYYNFEQHSGSGDWIRNTATMIGAMMHVDITESAVHPFPINFVGTSRIGGN